MFGWSVSLSSDGTILAAAAREYNNVGQVRVFQWSSGSGWSQKGNGIDGVAVDDEFGGSVSLSSDGNILAVGAADYDGTAGTKTGHVRVYEWSSGSGWTRKGADIEGVAAYDQFGISVSLSSAGTVLAVGAQSHSPGGHVRMFQWSGGSWTQLGADIEAEGGSDAFGRSVSLSSDGTRFAVGGPGNDDVDNNAGHVRVFQHVVLAPPAAPPPLPPAYLSAPPGLTLVHDTIFEGDMIVEARRALSPPQPRASVRSQPPPQPTD